MSKKNAGSQNWLFDKALNFVIRRLKNNVDPETRNKISTALMNEASSFNGQDYSYDAMVERLQHFIPKNMVPMAADVPQVHWHGGDGFERSAAPGLMTSHVIHEMPASSTFARGYSMGGSQYHMNDVGRQVYVNPVVSSQWNGHYQQPMYANSAQLSEPSSANLYQHPQRHQAGHKTHATYVYEYNDADNSPPVRQNQQQQQQQQCRCPYTGQLIPVDAASMPSQTSSPYYQQTSDNLTSQHDAAGIRDSRGRLISFGNIAAIDAYSTGAAHSFGQQPSRAISNPNIMPVHTMTPHSRHPVDKLINMPPTDDNETSHNHLHYTSNAKRFDQPMDSQYQAGSWGSQLMGNLSDDDILSSGRLPLQDQVYQTQHEAQTPTQTTHPTTVVPQDKMPKSCLKKTKPRTQIHIDHPRLPIGAKITTDKW